MTQPNVTRTLRLTVLAGSSALLLAACDRPLDMDLRGGFGDGFTTAHAATGPLDERPAPDNRGVISYPNYQVAVARRGDTLADVATRVGSDVGSLSRYNGIDATVPLRKGEIIALPTRVSEPSPATGASGTGPITTAAVDIQSMAGGAINRAPATPGVQTTALPSAQTTTRENPAKQTGIEPVRHKVERGETAYTIARLYAVPVETLAEWNGLGADFSVREGQFLLIPVAQQAAPKRSAAVPAAATARGREARRAKARTRRSQACRRCGQDDATRLFGPHVSPRTGQHHPRLFQGQERGHQHQGHTGCRGQSRR